LDGNTAFYSARSSFTQSNNLLFFASGLDPTATHDFRITNVDGNQLIIASAGLQALAINGNTRYVNQFPSPFTHSHPMLCFPLG
jgi:hypothetical protein